MVDTEYKIAYSEVLEILKYVSKEEFNKIPSNMIEMFKINSSNEKKFRYNLEKSLKEQKVSETARTIIAILFRDYWATAEQKEKILDVQNNEREKNRQEKYNPDNLFRKYQQNKFVEENIKNEDISIVEYKQPLLKRIIDKIKNIFHIR